VDASAGLYLRFTIRGSNASNGEIVLWWREPGATEWSRHYELLTEKGASRAATDLMQWGTITAATAQGLWRMAGWRNGGDWCSGIPTLTTLVATSASAGGMPLAFGHPLPARGYLRYPVPELTSTTSDLGYLAAAGRAYTSEAATLPVGHRHPIEHVYPTLTPSPSRYWESTGTTETLLAWDLTRRSWVGGSFALVVLGARPRQWVLEYDDLSTGWTTAGTLDLALGTGLLATRQGRTIVPRSGTTTISRYIQEGELVGGYILIGAGGGTVAREITHNSGGFWTADSTVQQVAIQVSGIDATEDASATIDIVHHSGVMVVHPSSQITRQSWRVRVAASQVTPSGTYRAGIVGIGRVIGIGADTSWDWSHRLELERTVTRDRSGAPVIERRGKPRRVLELGWRDGVHLLASRTLAMDPDYVGASGGVPIGTEEDAWASVWGILEHLTDSGEVPCVLLPQLPATSGTTITDRTLYVYGRAMVEALGVTGFVGTEGVDEAVRVDTLTVEEIR
jgi:hypothetical protein